MNQNDCMQELCWNWDGDGRHCICERLGVEPDTEERWPH